MAPPAGWSAEQPPPWLVPNVPPAGGVRPARRRPRTALIVAAVATVAIFGVGAFGTNAYAKNAVCSAMEKETALTGATAAEEQPEQTTPDIEQMREVSDELRGYGRMLILDGDLKSAVNGLADDMDQLAGLIGSEGDPPANGFAELMTIAGSLNSHAREAQRACGLPVRGFLND
jgi:hypothetical protein